MSQTYDPDRWDDRRDPDVDYGPADPTQRAVVARERIQAMREDLEVARNRRKP